MAVLKELKLIVSTFRGCSGLERTDFQSFYFGKVSAVLKELILTVSKLGMCGCLERNYFNNFYFGNVWQS